MQSRIGYLMPEFPGQTHTWVWREFRALTELGINADLVSTRKPGFVCHSWSAAAQAVTRYLVPFSPVDTIHIVQQMVRAGPTALGRCLKTVVDARESTPLGRLKLLGLIVVGCKLAHLARSRGWSHLHVLSAGDAAHLGAFASYLSGVDYSLTLLASLHGYGPNQRLKWRDASFALVMSNALLSEVRDKLGTAAPERISIAPMGADLEQAKRSKPYVPWRQGEPCRIYASGRLHPVKGHDYLLKAVTLLKQRGFRVQLEIAGDEHGATGQRALLQRIVRQDGLSESVDLLGAISEERHYQAIERAHVFALPSLDEGISVAAMEAMSMGTPVVVTDVGGMRELVEAEENGLMVPAKQAEPLADAIQRLLEDPELSLRLSRNSRERVASTFSHHRRAQLLAERFSVPPGSDWLPPNPPSGAGLEAGTSI